jgi:hypothetical protein
MQLKLKIVHVRGCFSLVDTDGVVYGKDGVIQTAFYAPGDAREQEDKLNELRAYARGVGDGWMLARNALGSPHVLMNVEEFVA